MTAISLLYRTACLCICGGVGVVSSTAFAQRNGYSPLRFEHVSVEDGLSNALVWRILQDHKGFLWIATGQGLNRFDGNEFTVFTHHGSGTLSRNDVWALFEDQSGTLWVGTFGGGLNKFDFATQGFTQFRNDSNNPNSLSNDNVRDIYEFADEPGVLWIATHGGGLNRFDANEETFTHYQHDPANPNSLSSDEIYGMYADMEGALWLGTAGGLSRMNRSQNAEHDRVARSSKITFINYLHDPVKPESLGEGSVIAIMEDRTGVLWVGTDVAGLSLLDKQKKAFTHYKNDQSNPVSLSNNWVTALAEDKEGNIWIGTYGGGLNKFQRETQSFVRYQSDPDLHESLSHNVVRSIYQDRTGIIWVATYGGGLNKIRPYKFFTYRHQRNNANSLAEGEVRAICEDRSGALWVGTQYGGITQIRSDDQGNTSFKHIRHDPHNANSLSDNYVLSIREAREQPGVFWIGTFTGGLNRFDSGTGNFKNYRHDPKKPGGLSANHVGAIHESFKHPGVFWIGSGEGLDRFDSRDSEFTRTGLRGDIVVIYEPPRQPDMLWVGVHGGGFFKLVLDDEGRVVTSVQYNPNNLASNGANTICPSKDGSLWVGTKEGLSRFDPATETFTSYSESQGLPACAIIGIVEDGKGNLWMSTDIGLLQFNPETEMLRKYDIADGLQGNHFLLRAYAKGQSGRMYFGGINGLSVFDPDSIKHNEYVPPIVFTDFKVFNKSAIIGATGTSEEFTMPQHITETDEIVLSYKQNVYSFDFAALDFTAPQKNQYGYKMDGFDEDWIYSENQRSATYTNLAPGDYVFRVKGSNNDGVWNHHGAAIKIAIQPPWWRRWWAYSLYASILGFTLYGLRRFEKNRHQLRHEAALHRVETEKLQEVDAVKSRFFANISHEFRTPLTLIMGQIESELDSPDEKKDRSKLHMAARNAQRLLTLINQLLDLSKFEAGQMTLRASQQNIVPLLRHLVSSFESWAAQKKIALQFEPSHDQIVIWYEQDKIEKVMYNLLSNAVKFTPEGGRVSVQLSVTSEQSQDTEGSTHHSLLISVRDSGIGIPPDRLPHIFDRFFQVDSSQTREFEGTGIGLALTQELVQIHGGGISVQSTEGFGTTFVVSLPLGKGHLKTEQIVEVTKTPDSLIGFEALSDVEQASVKTNIPLSPPSKGEDYVLIVEDNADMRSFITESLQDGYRIIEAANGEEGFVKAQEYIPDLIITDVMMPRVDGYEMTRRIRQDQITSHIPIIMLTAKAADEDKFEGLERGVDAYLTKPFNKKELRIRVRKLIELRRQLRQRAGVKAVLSPSEIEASSMDQEFLQRVQECIEKNMENENFGVDDLAAQIGVGKRQLQRKLKALIDSSPQQCVRTMRLQRARQLLERGAGTISEIAFQVGYSEGSALARAFREEFGFAPSEIKSPKEK